MRFTILKDGELINTIVASEKFVKTYCERCGYTYVASLLPEPEPVEPEPTPDDDRDAMLVDLEYRVTLLELGLEEEI